MKILIFATGSLSIGAQELKLSIEIVNLGHTVYFLTNDKPKLFDVGHIAEIPENLHIINVNQQEISVPNDIDACFGMDQSVADHVLHFKKSHPEVYSVCMFLDYPVHVVDDQSSLSYSFDYSQRYYYWLDAAKQLDDIVFNNSVAVEHYKKRFNKKASLIWYSISTEDVVIPTYIKEDYVVSCNRLIHYKGTDLLVDALSRLDYNYKHIGVSGELKDVFLQRCNHAFKNRFEFFERCDENKKIELISKAKMLVYPQITDWIGGLSVLEAYSVKTPTICFDYPVLRELYEDCTIYVKQKSIIDLRKKIKELYEDKDMQKKYADKGYERYKKHFTKKIMAQNIVNLLNKGI